MNAIEERIAKILIDNFKVEYEFIGPDTTFNEVGFDSLVIVELALVLSEEFGVVIEDGEFVDAMTLAEAGELMLAKGAVA